VIEPLLFDEAAADQSAAARIYLDNKGISIGAYDCLLAGYALALGSPILVETGGNVLRLRQAADQFGFAELLEKRLQALAKNKMPIQECHRHWLMVAVRPEADSSSLRDCVSVEWHNRC